ncbi:phosphopantetheine-binding protein [Streptomyces sp. MRC013]|uniref:phosphopantetheine-binding protein n=1 Tax=Streptomyces sp. MRC013 TaxID=2898276 RepID=UPI0032E9DC5F
MPRTRFAGGHTEPRQVVDQVTDRLKVTELAHLPEDLPPYEAPCTPVEEAVAELWANTLRVERVGVHDDFSALGGDSLTAMRAVVHLCKALGTELPVRVSFDDETLEDTALVIEDHLLAGIGKLSGEEARALLAG